MYHTHPLGELCVFIYEISWKTIYQMQSRLQNDSALQTYCSSPGCSPRGTHTARTRAHTHICTHTHAQDSSLAGRRASALRNLAAWEMFVFMPQTHLGGGRAPRCTGLNPTRVLQVAAWEGFCPQGSQPGATGVGGGGLQGWAGSLGSSAGARGQESELGERLMLEQKAENVSG